MISSNSSTMRWIPIILLIVSVFVLAVAIVIVLSLISIYIPNQATSNICQISFASMISQATGAGPMAVKVADLNNDSFLDLVVANYNDGTTSVLLGNGNGSFERHVDLSNGSNAGTNGIAVGDINKDNQSDIVVVNRNASNVGIFLGYGNGSFSQQITFSTGIGSAPVALVLNDLNNDGVLDLVVTDHHNSLVLVFLGTDNGTFIKILTLSTGNDSGPYLIVIDDFNKDNRLDITVGNGDVGGNYVSIFLGNGTGGFSEQTTYYIKSGPYALTTADFNRDSILDIVTANYDGNNTSVLFGNGDGTFRQGYTFSTGSGSLSYAIVNGDFNRDNIQDLIVPNSGTDNVGILLGYGNEKFRNQKTYSTGHDSGPVDVTVGDLNGDNRLDFISANSNDNTIAQLNFSRISIDAKWIQNGITVAGGNGYGNGLDQFSSPVGVYVDDDQTIYVADNGNHRIVEWKRGATSGHVVAGGNGQGDRNDQLNTPVNVIIDKENDSFIISDQGNGRVVRWPRRNGTRGEPIISNVSCCGLAINNNGYLYVSDGNKHEVRRWKIGETTGTLVAGGNGQGNRLDQLSTPYLIFIDEDHSVYISEFKNHRVMKWMKGAKEGIVVAGGQGPGNSLTQLSNPFGIIVDQLGTIYIADYGNHRVMRWLKGAREGSIIVDGNGQGSQSNQFYYPFDLSFDRQNNLYVVDHDNHRVQKFVIE